MLLHERHYKGEETTQYVDACLTTGEMDSNSRNHNIFHMQQYTALKNS